MLAGEYCNRDVIIIGRSDSILKAAKLMREHHVGDVLVVESVKGERTPIGILTDRDIVVDVLAKYDHAHDIAIQDVFNNRLITIHEKDDLMVAIKQMRLNGVRRIPVINDTGGLVGILSVEDVLDVITEQLMDIGQTLTNEKNNEEKLVAISA